MCIRDRINGNVYYFDSNSCKLQTGERTFNGQTHTFTENGTTDGGPYVYTCLLYTSRCV